MRMTSTATGLAARRNVAMRDGEEVNDAVSRAASFRGESDMLRRRARAGREDVIRDQYLALADRFSMLAASLEVQAMAELIG
jgi:hypothetical protein